MKTRILLGITLIALVAGIFYLDYWLQSRDGGETHPWGFLALAIAASTIAAHEACRIFRELGAAPFRSELFLSGWILTGFVSLAPADQVLATATLAICASVFLLLLLIGSSRIWNSEVKVLGPRMAGSIAVHVYVFLPCAALIAIRKLEGQGDPHLGLWLIIFLVAVGRLGADSGAYFVGRAIGKHKLIPAVSPGKTIEGHIGGLVVALGIGWLLWWLIPGLREPFELHTALIASAAIWLFASSGDLLASALKRGAGVKDSGSLLPEFGGIIDLIDGFLLVGPFFFLALILYKA